MIFLAIVSGIAGLILGLVGVGFGAAELLQATHGGREGAAAMQGFFFFGPIGGLAGGLLGVGLVCRFSGRSTKWGKRLMIASAVVMGLCVALLAITAAPESKPEYSFVIEFEVEVPATVLSGIDVPGPNAMWGAASGDADDTPISRFFEKKCEADVCVLTGSVAALGPLDKFRIAVHLGPKSYRFPLDLPAAISGPMDWSAWRPTDDARSRWRIVKR